MEETQMSDFPIDNLSMKSKVFPGDMEVWIDGKKYYRSLDRNVLMKDGSIRSYPLTSPDEEAVFDVTGRIDIIKIGDLT